MGIGPSRWRVARTPDWAGLAAATVSALGLLGMIKAVRDVGETACFAGDCSGLGTGLEARPRLAVAAAILVAGAAGWATLSAWQAAISCAVCGVGLATWGYVAPASLWWGGLVFPLIAIAVMSSAIGALYLRSKESGLALLASIAAGTIASTMADRRTGLAIGVLVGMLALTLLVLRARRQHRTAD